MTEPEMGRTPADLLAHMTAQDNGFAAAAAGDGADLVRWQTGAPAADPVGEYATAVVALLGRRPGWPA